MTAHLQLNIIIIIIIIVVVVVVVPNMTYRRQNRMNYDNCLSSPKFWRALLMWEKVKFILEQAVKTHMGSRSILVRHL